MHIIPAEVMKWKQQKEGNEKTSKGLKIERAREMKHTKGEHTKEGKWRRYLNRKERENGVLAN